MDWRNDYSEQVWRNDTETRERGQARNEMIQMKDWQAESFASSLCDGSGILEDFFIEVDQTQVIPRPVCCACQESDLEQARRRAPLTELTPLWTEADIQHGDRWL